MAYAASPQPSLGGATATPKQAAALASGTYVAPSGGSSAGSSAVSTSSSSVPAGWTASAWNQQLADVAKYFPNGATSTTQPVSAAGVGTTAFPNLPGAPAPQNVGALVAGNNAGLVNPGLGLSLDPSGNLVFNAPTTAPATSSGSTTPSASTDGFMANLKSYLGLQTPPPSATDIYNSLPEKATFEAAQQNVQNLTGQLNGIVAKSQADSLSVTGQGRGVPEAIIGGQQAEIAKEAAIQALPVQAQLAAAQGNLQLAQDHLDTVFKLREQDAQSKYDYQTKLIDSVFTFANQEEQRRLDDMKTTAASNLSRVNNALNFAQTLSTSATKNGQVDVAASLTKLVPPDPSSKTFNQDLIDYNASISKIQGQIKGDSTAVQDYGYIDASNVADKNASQSQWGGLSYNALYNNAQRYLATGSMPALGLGQNANVQAARLSIQNYAGQLADAAGLTQPQIQALYKANSTAASQIIQRVAKVDTISASLTTQFPRLADLAGKVGNLGITESDVTAGKAKVQQKFGSVDAANYVELLNTVRGDYAALQSAYAGSRGGEYFSRSAADAVPAGLTPDQYLGIMNTMQQSATNANVATQAVANNLISGIGAGTSTTNPASVIISPSNTKIDGLTAKVSGTGTIADGIYTFPTMSQLLEFKKDHGL